MMNMLFQNPNLKLPDWLLKLYRPPNTWLAQSSCYIVESLNVRTLCVPPFVIVACASVAYFKTVNCSRVRKSKRQATSALAGHCAKIALR